MIHTIWLALLTSGCTAPVETDDLQDTGNSGEVVEDDDDDDDNGEPINSEMTQLSGTVRAPDGTPVVGMLVQLCQGTQCDPGLTDDSGIYKFKNVLPDKYALHATPIGSLDYMDIMVTTLTTLVLTGPLPSS